MFCDNWKVFTSKPGRLKKLPIATLEHKFLTFDLIFQSCFAGQLCFQMHCTIGEKPPHIRLACRLLKIKWIIRLNNKQTILTKALTGLPFEAGHFAWDVVVGVSVNWRVSRDTWWVTHAEWWKARVFWNLVYLKSLLCLALSVVYYSVDLIFMVYSVMCLKK